jgi:hypothetical protein
VSKNTSWSSPSVSTPIIRVRVVWGFFDTMAIFSPISLFSMVDFPTLGRPTMAMYADL